MIQSINKLTMHTKIKTIVYRYISYVGNEELVACMLHAITISSDNDLTPDIMAAINNSKPLCSSQPLRVSVMYSCYRKGDCHR